ncbi:MAG: hypothetical protein ACI8XO_000972, partial [Verrucomicrobiales bacterium]
FNFICGLVTSCEITNLKISDSQASGRFPQTAWSHIHTGAGGGAGDKIREADGETCQK